jgi:hypothetical protein
MNKIYIVKKIIWNISQLFVYFIFLHYQANTEYPNQKILLHSLVNHHVSKSKDQLHYWDNHRVPKSEKKINYPDKDCVLKSEDIITLSRSVHILIYYYITETNTQCPYSNPEKMIFFTIYILFIGNKFIHSLYMYIYLNVGRMDPWRKDPMP